MSEKIRYINISKSIFLLWSFCQNVAIIWLMAFNLENMTRRLYYVVVVTSFFLLFHYWVYNLLFFHILFLFKHGLIIRFSIKHNECWHHKINGKVNNTDFFTSHYSFIWSMLSFISVSENKRKIHEWKIITRQTNEPQKYCALSRSILQKLMRFSFVGFGVAKIVKHLVYLI